MEVSVVLPTRNEKESIGQCIKNIEHIFEKHKIKGEIIVSDSSKDGSDKIAKKLGAKVIKHNKEGYGRALLEGFQHAKGKIIIYADPDSSYDFLEIPKFLEAIKKVDLVVSSRLKGDMKKNSMPWTHKYLGNPGLTFLLNLFFKGKFSDTHSGFRAIRKEALKKLDLKTTGMEFASELLIKALKHNLKIKEVPISYSPRKGNSKLKTWNDGWRHLRFMLLFSPNYLFTLPGTILFIMGLLIQLALLAGPITILGFNFYTHPMIIGSFLMIAGFQILFTGFFAKSYLFSVLEEENKKLKKLFKKFNLEKGIILGLAVFLLGLILGMLVLIKWANSNFGNLTEIKLLIFALTLNILGVQLFFNSFYLSMLGIKRK